MTSLQLVKVNFHGDALEAVQLDGGQIVVSLRRMCEALGVSAHGQEERLARLVEQGEDWAVTRKIRATGPDGKTYAVTGLAVDSVPMWLTGISINKVRPEVQDKLRLYKREVAQVLRDHFLGRGAPRSTNEGMLLALLDHERRLLETQARQKELAATQADQEARVTAVEDAILEVAEAVAKPRGISIVIPDDKQTLKTLRNNFAARLKEAFADEYRQDAVDWPQLNYQLKHFAANGAKRENWTFAHFKQAIDYLMRNYGKDLSDLIA